MRPKTRTSAKTFLEVLESRIAPAGLAGINYIDVTLGTHQLLKAGQGLKANGVYLMAVTQGEALVYTTDLNGSNKFDYNDITGIAAGNGLKLTSFVNINGDIVTDLQADGTLSNSNGNNIGGHDGLLLLNSKIAAITLRSVTAADITPADLAQAQVQTPGATADSIYTNFLAPSTYSINGNIYAGGGIGDGVVGDGIVIDTIGTAAQVAKYKGTDTAYYQVAGINPYIGAIKTGTAAGGNTFSFGYYPTTTSSHTAGDLQGGGTLKTYTPGVGVAGGDIIGLSVGSGASTDTTFLPSNPVAFTVNAIVAGDGGIGAKGGSISNVTLDGDSGGLRIQAGDGGDGSTSSGTKSGDGGSILNLSDYGSIEGVVQIKTGSGGKGFTGPGGSAGNLSLGQFSMNGDIHFDLGNAGDSQGNAGAGASLTAGTLTPTDKGGLASAVDVVTTYRAAGDIGTPKLIDFNGDGYTDMVFMTHSPDQLGIAFGSPIFNDPNAPIGISSNSPVLYLAVPGLASLDTATSAITVGDFNGDGLPDVAVASSVANTTTGISVFLNPGNDTNGTSIWGTDAQSTTGGNFVDSSIHVAVPNLRNEGFLISGAAITNLVTGDFNHDGKLDLAYTTQVSYNDGSNNIKSATNVVEMDGSGDGHFFANFQSGTPVLFRPGDKDIPAGNTTCILKSTAASAGNINSDLIVLSDGKAISLLQDVSGNLSVVDSQKPQYDVPNFTTIGTATVISNWGSPVKAIPVDFTVTSIGNSGVFDVVVLDQGNAVSLLAGVYDSLNNIPSFAAYDNSGNAPGVASGGVMLTGDKTAQIQNQPVLAGVDAAFLGIIAGSFAGGTSSAQFALYASTVYQTLDLAGYNLHGVSTYQPTGVLPGNLSSTGSADTLGVRKADYDASVIAFDLFNNDATSTAGANSFAPLVSAGTTFGFVQAMPTSDADGVGSASFSGLINGSGSYTVNGGPSQNVYAYSHGLNDYAITVIAGNGGNSDLGAGGAGGSIGIGSLKTTTTSAGTTTTASVTITLPSTEPDQPAIHLIAGNGGNGLTSGGNGGGLQSLIVNYVTGTTTLYGSVTMQAGNGGNGVFGQGGAGGSLTKFQTQSGYDFVAGDGGSGYRGGNGGIIDGNNGSYTTYEIEVSLKAGNGGSGIASGGNGGNITNFYPLFLPPVTAGDSPFRGHLYYQAGSGGSAVAGAGGMGGSVLNSSPASSVNYLAGPIIISAGNGGDGLSGGAGGSVSGFKNQSTAATPISEVSILAGNGGIGITGNGGAGGSISSISASSGQTDYNYEYNRIIAGDGGKSYGAAGGGGGNLTNVNSTAGSTAEAIAAGNGGDGLTRGGNGGSIVSVTGNSADSPTSKLLVFAGAGGNAYGAVYAIDKNGNNLNNIGLEGDTNPVILALRAFGNANGVGGNGGNITNFTQPTSTQVAVDLIAGNGGSLMNYGSSSFLTSNVGKGGSLSNVSLGGTAGRIDSAIAIQTYGGVGTSVSSFVQNVLRDNPYISISDSGNYGGNVGVIAGSAGTLKADISSQQGGNLPAGDAVAKTGSVTTFSARSIMSMIAGSVDNIAAINTISGLTLTDVASGVYGSYKTNPIGYQTPVTDSVYAHDINNPLYLKDGLEYPIDYSYSNQSQTALIGGALMDGAIVAINKPASLAGQTRVF